MPQNWDSGGYFVFIIFFIFAKIQNFSKVGWAKQSPRVGVQEDTSFIHHIFHFCQHPKLPEDKIMLHSTSELGSGRTFSLLTMIFILQTCQA